MQLLEPLFPVIISKKEATSTDEHSYGGGQVKICGIGNMERTTKRNHSSPGGVFKIDTARRLDSWEYLE